MKKTVFLLFAVLVMLGAATNVSAMPASPKPIEFTQPDGSMITIILKGDEKVSWSQTLDGYTLMLNSDGFLTYAIKDSKGNLQPSNVIAKDVAARDIQDKTMLSSIEKGLFYSNGQISLMKEIWDVADAQAKSTKASKISSEGKKNILFALVGFSEYEGRPAEPFERTQKEFYNMANQLGYSDNNAKGSVRDWFLETSYGKLDLTFTVAGPYMAPKSEWYYTGGYKNAKCSELARWILEQVEADEAGYDLSNLDSDGDGVADCFHFIYAGNGQEATGISGTIWSHKSSIMGGTTVGGMRFTTYSCSPERNSSNKTAMATIGVICHEMTHIFGAPDYYDTDYEKSGGNFPGTGEWDVMGSGGYNGSPSGSTPACHNMFQKIKFGWVTPKELTEPTSIIVMPNSNEHPVAYTVSTTTDKEYFVLENRQKLNFDKEVPGSGLLIYHINKNMDGYNGNSVNVSHQQMVYPIFAASQIDLPNSDPASYGNVNTNSCPFPGASNKTEFTDDSTPSAKSWANANTGKPITNIAMADTAFTVSFNFMGGRNSTCSAPKNLNIEYIRDNGVNLTWGAPDGETPESYNIYRNNKLIEEGVPGLTYKDTSYKHANYTYYVTANIGDCESMASNIRSILIPTYYMIGVTSTDENAGTITGAGEYKKGERVKLRISVNGDNTFLYWINEDNTVLSKSTLYQFEALRDLNITAVFNNPIGVEENIDITDVRVFAANGEINIQVENNDRVVNIDVIDLNGRVVRSEIMSGSSAKISLAKRGVYVVRVISDSKVFSKKVIL